MGDGVVERSGLPRLGDLLPPGSGAGPLRRWQDGDPIPEGLLAVGSRTEGFLLSERLPCGCPELTATGMMGPPHRCCLCHDAGFLRTQASVREHHLAQRELCPKCTNVKARRIE